MPAPYTGKCLCGGVHLKISSEPVTVVSCHCGHCSKGAGGTNQVVAPFPKDDVEVTKGQELITTYVFTDTSSGKGKDKTFCKVCGTPLWTVTESARVQNQLLVRTVVLENGLTWKPACAIFTKNRPSWLPAASGVVDYEAAP
ncbi:Mss4-like protein [Podospora didyma]|uniref:Mss4-like protein n=1 Tax=Podospora didyma TaxID=330526 RepID=A0AAE0P0U2_9PEZI|nr:Mss4-like protein [Podospora didyma]